MNNIWKRKKNTLQIKIIKTLIWDWQGGTQRHLPHKPDNRTPQSQIKVEAKNRAQKTLCPPHRCHGTRFDTQASHAQMLHNTHHTSTYIHKRQGHTFFSGTHILAIQISSFIIFFIRKRKAPCKPPLFHTSKVEHNERTNSFFRASSGKY